MQKMIRLMTLSALVLPLSLMAQTREGKVTYERTINMHKNIPPDFEQFKAMVPEFNTTTYELYFTPTTSLYKAAKQAENQLPSADGGGNRMMFRMGADNSETFRDYEKEIIIESRELGPNRYLLDDTLRPMKWKLEDETMTVGGFECRKATTTIKPSAMMGGMRMGGPRGGGNEAMQEMMNRELTVVAWYTDQVETTAGPENFFGLPGLILYIDIDNGTTVYKPVKLEPLSNKDNVKAPTKGKKITREEYRKMMQQQMQGMGGGGMRIGGPTMIIRQ